MVGLEGFANKANSHYHSPLRMKNQHKKIRSMSKLYDFKKQNLKINY